MKELVTVTNRAMHQVGYTLDDSRIYRKFAPGETKRLPIEELQELVWTSGGKSVLDKYLIIKEPNAREILFGVAEVEPEYLYTKEDIKKLILNGTVEELEDCINFSPEGNKSLIIECAFETEVGDIKKRELIKNKLGYDITKMIEISRQENQDTNDKEDKPVRRAAAPTGPVRKAAKPSWD